MHQTSTRPEKRAAKLPKRQEQRERQSDFMWPWSKNDDPAYRKN
jgi:hypothetical protein